MLPNITIVDHISEFSYMYISRIATQLLAEAGGGGDWKIIQKLLKTKDTGNYVTMEVIWLLANR